MKKIILTISMIMCLGSMSFAQKDGFFNNWEDFDNREEQDFYPVLPISHGLTDDYDAPLTDGLLILSALGAGYLISKKRKIS